MLENNMRVRAKTLKTATVLCVLILAGCDVDNSPTVTILISDTDGCKTYQIERPYNSNVYFTKCDATAQKPVITSHQESCGKACTRTVTESTN